MYRLLSKILLAALSVVTFYVIPAMAQGENAAPSQHIFFEFPDDAIAKIHKVKITQSADAEYFSVHNFRGGYNGLQQTPDKAFGTPNILIASLWDPNTAGGVFSKVAYAGAQTFKSRFGGEGDGWKTINPYKWTLNTWYNIAIRAWKSNGRLFVGTFIQDMSTGVWFHTSTLEMADRAIYLGPRNDAFLENWSGYDPRHDGRFIRKAFFKDCWNLTVNNVWQKHTTRKFSANDNDKKRNGIYDRSFNSGYDVAEDAYFMQHGGDTQPDQAFGTGRVLSLPEQRGQGNAPKLTVGALADVNAVYSAGIVTVNWTIDDKKSPQLSSKIEIVNASGTVIQTVEEVLPEKRSAQLKANLQPGTYTARITLTDIFNRTGKIVNRKFVVKAR